MKTPLTIQTRNPKKRRFFERGMLLEIYSYFNQALSLTSSQDLKLALPTRVVLVRFPHSMHGYQSCDVYLPFSLLKISSFRLISLAHHHKMLFLKRRCSVHQFCIQNIQRARVRKPIWEMMVSQKKPNNYPFKAKNGGAFKNISWSAEALW